MFKKLTVIAVVVFAGTISGVGVAGADPGDSANVTVVNQAPYANPYKTNITVTGTYSCQIVPETWTPTNESLNVNVSQIQKKNTVVTGMGGAGGFGGGGGGGGGGTPFSATCDGTAHPWSFAIPAQIPGTQTAATWSKGKAVVQVSLNLSDNNFPNNDQVSASVTSVLAIP